METQDYNKKVLTATAVNDNYKVGWKMQDPAGGLLCEKLVVNRSQWNGSHIIRLGHQKCFVD